MIYLSLDKNRIKLLYLKKSLLGQYDFGYGEKKFQADLLEKGSVANTDILASAIKETFNHNEALKQVKEKEVFLILPQESFKFVRCEVPVDVAPSAIVSFIKNKVEASLHIDVEETFFDYFYTDNGNQKQISAYIIDKQTLTKFQEAFNLIELKITGLISDTLAYFKLFEKTIRKDKQENIFYVEYADNSLSGYLFDSFGLIQSERYLQVLSEKITVEKALKEKVSDFLEKKRKVNRLVLSGEDSQTIRQDTFTKNTGAWTNPLKRILSNFYQDYLKMITPGNQPLPVLKYDICFGAFIFSLENKNFALLKKNVSLSIRSKSSLPKFNFAYGKELLIFIVSFGLSFTLFVLLNNLKIKGPDFNSNQTVVNKTTPSTLPSPIPTPPFTRAELKIKILNGSGTKGKATVVKDILKEKGYQEILTGNADTFDFDQSLIEVKKTKLAAAEFIKIDLKDYVNTFKQSELDEKESADIIIIVGKDFK